MADHVLIEGLRITYRDDAGVEAAAVAGADLRLARGETLGIVGESGSGKSTLARALLGHARPGARFAAGRVRVGDTDVLSLPPADLRAFRGRRAAMVPQNPLSSLTPHLPVGAQLAELVRVHTDLAGPAVAERVHALMAKTGLPDPARLSRRYPHELSGGQRQRAVIAAALIGRPELIVLDEPTTALDKSVEARVLALIQDVQAELGATLIYVSHDLAVIRRVCARVVVMRAGEIVEEGTTGAVLERPRGAYARALVAAVPRADDRGPPPVAGAEPVLTIADLRFAYGRPAGVLERVLAPVRALAPGSARPPAAPALAGVTLTVRRGETLGVVGESGSGKSTLAAVIAGVVAGHTGEILLGDVPVAGPARRRSADLRRRIQLVFQDSLSALNPTQTVAEILARPLRLHRGLSAAAARSEAAALMEQMALSPDLLERRPRQLSGGQQQRVGLARALAAQPDLLICDEVTSALDVTIQAQVLDLFQRLQRERGLTCLFISHDLGVIARVSHRIAVMEGGHLREIGDRETVLRAPSTPFTRRLLEAASPLPAPAAAESAGSGVPSARAHDLA